MKYIAVLGHGTVGSGVTELFIKNRTSIERKAGMELDIKYILDIRDFPDHPLADRFTKDFEKIVNDPEVAVVVEVIGGLNPSYSYVKRCLENGKSVVTSNKELVATHGAELLKLAKDNNLNFLFEASVGGGIPIIRPLSQCLSANELFEIAGILNGTTNYILTKMITDGISFETALANAQELGYAERNPSADVDGADSCRKICILASLAFGHHIYPDKVYTEGIRNISLKDVEAAKSFGGVIKLIAAASRLENGKVQIFVAPCILNKVSQLSHVDDVFNAILVKGDAIGDVIFYGRGAGKMPTASAVVADVIDAVKHISARKMLYWSDAIEGSVEDFDKFQTSYYVRCLRNEKTAKLVASVFGSVNYIEGYGDAELSFITPLSTEGELKAKCEQLKAEGIDVYSTIRVIDL
ncbi:MAG: homoserine dehydrogenase [Clostridia bacterium]|nr:homoserine dehydrogenase [Clostridia bacterium]